MSEHAPRLSSYDDILIEQLLTVPELVPTREQAPEPSEIYVPRSDIANELHENTSTRASQ